MRAFDENETWLARFLRRQGRSANCTLDAHLCSRYVPRHPRSLRASPGDVRSAERGWRRLQARLVTSSQEARSPSGPDEGPAFSGLDNIGRRAAPMLPGSREVQASGPVKEDTVIGPKIAAVERRKVRVPVIRHAGAFAKVPSYDLRHFGAPLPHF